MATLSDARRIVIKIGSALLVDRRTGALKADWLRALAEDVAWLCSSASSDSPSPSAPRPRAIEPEETRITSARCRS